MNFMYNLKLEARVMMWRVRDLFNLYRVKIIMWRGKL